MNSSQFSEIMSNYTMEKIPYFFLVDFEMEQPFICKLDEARDFDVFYNLNGKTNVQEEVINETPVLDWFPINKMEYSAKLDRVVEYLKNGDSYLTNLTFPTPIQINLSLQEVFHKSKASYKLLFKNDFVVFSPESFVKITGNKISTYPMKGTIDATLPHAEQQLLDNEKEAWEHHTIVDLMRNDLSIIAENIQVDKFRFIDKIKTHKGEILQTSTAISGTLPENWQLDFGERFLKLLPAGSISGAPKKKTIEIIQAVEGQKRGYYTGVFGIFDGNNVDSAVAIRFIEKRKEDFLFRSGGGITANSDVEKEYKELLQKIYIPI